ncbi:MAG: PaaI family thioesterase [Ruminococcaceae bacterium]|nr:PaaI family thioesterase [Oscillospiraceae bacterium]
MANTLEEISIFFEGDRYATEVSGIVIEKAEKGHSIVSLEPDGRHMNAVGGLMGAVYYTLADFAFAVAENCVLDSDVMTVTQSAQINFLRPWTGGKVTCRADIVKDGRAVCLYEIKVFGSDDRELALIIVNGFKTARK